MVSCGDLPNRKPAFGRYGLCIPVGGIPKIDEACRRILYGAVRERTFTGAQNPKLVAVEMQGMAHLLIDNVSNQDTQCLGSANPEGESAPCR